MYRDHFPDRAVFPVIHILSIGQIIDNLNIVADHDADGAFLIDHSGQSPEILRQLILLIRKEGWFERLWIGTNFLGLSYHDAFEFAYKLNLGGVWADTIEALDPKAVSPRLDTTNFGREFPLTFGGIAFKYQPQHGDGTEEARRAVSIGLADILTTSGPATGKPASIDKLQLIRAAIGDHPLAVASGVTPENVAEQLPYVDAFLVATGISRDPYNFDPARLRSLVNTVHAYQPPQ